MPETGGVGGRVPPKVAQRTDRRRAAAAGRSRDARTPPADAPGASRLARILNATPAGRRPSPRLVAAERMRAAGLSPATDELLCLNRRPSIRGALAAPPGGAEALRHVSPAPRRALMRSLLGRRTAQTQRLTSLLCSAHDGGRRVGHARRGPGGEPDGGMPDVGEAQLARARSELERAARMLSILRELSSMQDHTLSKMGTLFSAG
jgi:hypothetical protein